VSVIEEGFREREVFDIKERKKNEELYEECDG
jgi:hypothetical protein